MRINSLGTTITYVRLLTFSSSTWIRMIYLITSVL